MATDGDEPDPWDFLAAPKKAAPTEVPAVADDPWDFLAARKAKVASALEATESEGYDLAQKPTKSVDEPAPPRARGELRADMGGPSLRRRAWPLALALAAVAFAAFLTEIVASSQMLALAGPISLVVVYPLGGLGLLLVALLQFRYVDQKARLPLLRGVTLVYAAVFVVALALVAASVVPLAATALIWLLGDQLSFLLPLLIWSLVGDEFNVAEGRKIFGWIVACVYVGQVLGLVISAVSPAIFSAAHIPLPYLLVADPVVCVLVGVLLPRALKGTAASSGLVRAESLRESVTGALDFINGVPIWRPFLVSSVLSFVAGLTAYITYLGGVGRVMGSDAAGLQTLLGSVALVTFVFCWILQVVAAEKIQDRIGIQGVLMIVPIAAVGACALLALGTGLGSVTIMVIGISLWNVPRWSIDQNARRAALALVPDERRARLSLIVDLGSVAIGLIVAGPLALIGIATGIYWISPVAAAIAAACAIPFSLRVFRGWEDSLLNWRLRRRKQNRVLDLGID